MISGDERCRLDCLLTWHISTCQFLTAKKEMRVSARISVPMKTRSMKRNDKNNAEGKRLDFMCHMITTRLLSASICRCSHPISKTCPLPIAISRTRRTRRSLSATVGPDLLSSRGDSCGKEKTTVTRLLGARHRSDPWNASEKYIIFTFFVSCIPFCQHCCSTRSYSVSH